MRVRVRAVAVGLGDAAYLTDPLRRGRRAFGPVITKGFFLAKDKTLIAT
jgi:hypothetical protein